MAIDDRELFELEALVRAELAAGRAPALPAREVGEAAQAWAEEQEAERRAAAGGGARGGSDGCTQ